MVRGHGYRSAWTGVDITTPFENPVNGSGGPLGVAPWTISMPSTTKSVAGVAIGRWGGKASSGSNTWGGSNYGTNYTGQTTGPSAAPNNSVNVFGYGFETTPAAPGSIAGPVYNGIASTTNPLATYVTRTSVLRGASSAPVRASSATATFTDDGSTLSVSFPTLAANQFVLFELHIDEPNAVVGTPSGWTKNFDVAHANGRLLSFYRALGAGGLAAGTFAIPYTIVTGPPVNTSAPVVSGTASIGSTLACTTGSWSPAATSYAYQWQRDGSDIAGATGSNYTLVSGDAGHTIRCVVTATNSGGSASANSNGIAIPAAPTNTVAPVVTTDGTPATGETISCSTGTWTPTPDSYAYQWYRGASPISGETGATYTLVVTDEGASISCRVTATNGGGSTTANSNSITPAVTAPITDASFLYYYSGGTGNTDPALSIGGARGGTLPGSLDALFGPIIGSVAQAGGVFYRVVYVRNTHTISTAAAMKLFLEQEYASSGLHLAVAVPTQARNVDVPALASGTTAPTGVTWTSTIDPASGGDMGDLGPGDVRGIYLRLTVDPGTTKTVEDDAIVAVEGSAA